MAELKTKKTNASVKAFIETVEDEQKRMDCFELVKIMEDVTKEKAAMWGTAIVGFGSYYYESERSSQKGTWPLTGFSPRKQNLTIYVMPGFTEYKHLMSKLGKYKTSVSCLYVKKLKDIDTDVLKKLIALSVEEMRKRYPKKA
jgi:hypothetical protein